MDGKPKNSSNTIKTYAFNKLQPNHKIPQNFFIMSLNQQYFARIQEDGNFVVYKTNNFLPSNAIWNSSTAGKGSPPYKLIMQKDGNLVIYDKSNKAIWASNTCKKGKNPCELCIFDSGKLGIVDSEGKTIWESKK